MAFKFDFTDVNTEPETVIGEIVDSSRVNKILATKKDGILEIITRNNFDKIRTDSLIEAHEIQVDLVDGWE